MAVGVAQQLRGPLAAGIRGERTVAGIGFHKRQALGVAIGGGSGSEHEIADSMPACGFQKVQGADEIDIEVKMRIFNRRPHTSHGAQVHNGFERLTLK